jgi:hypothetical protein
LEPEQMISDHFVSVAALRAAVGAR